jgi:hypothetical protein
MQKFEMNPQDATALLQVGMKDVKDGDAPETAALMMVAQVLYNLDETITKE